MNPLLLPYLFNIAVWLPIGSLTLFGGERGWRLACQGMGRTLLGSVGTAVPVGSLVGLFVPVAMAPLLMVQVVYKTFWLVVYAPTRLLGGRNGGAFGGGASR